MNNNGVQSLFYVLTDTWRSREKDCISVAYIDGRFETESSCHRHGCNQQT